MRAPVAAWGRLSHAVHATVALRDRRTAHAAIGDVAARPGLAHGAGRSYGDQALNAGGTLWLTRGLDRFIAFDAATGVLRCEAGVTLAQITAVALPRGWFLPVTPGTQFATIGGAVANDVHGKNHHARGTLGEHVTALTLWRTDGEVIACGPAERPEWFAATVGGMGLTGVIADVTVRLRPVPGGWIDTLTEPFESLDEFFALSARHTAAWEYSVAWIDCLRSPTGATRGVFFCGNHAARAEPLPAVRPKSAALLPPLPWVNAATCRLFNAAYHRRARARAGAAVQPYTAFFYPLDGVLEWNRIYGRAGFYQYQCVVPEAVQQGATRELLGLIQASDTGSFLSVLKTFAARPAVGLMSFPMAGTTLALDFPNRGDATRRLFERLDAVVAAAGGRLYAAKDAAMPAALFRQGHPRLDEFMRYRDPGIASDLSRRLLGR